MGDFGKCGSNAGNSYNFPFLSDCVKDYSRSEDRKCRDPARPVACSVGNCQSDYITCLKAIVGLEESLGTPELKKVKEKLQHVAARKKLMASGEFALKD